MKKRTMLRDATDTEAERGWFEIINDSVCEIASRNSMSDEMVQRSPSSSLYLIANRSSPNIELVMSTNDAKLGCESSVMRRISSLYCSFSVSMVDEGEGRGGGG
jgi:hypothetical protein